jgi:hypothetical protein
MLNLIIKPDTMPTGPGVPYLVQQVPQPLKMIMMVGFSFKWAPFKANWGTVDTKIQSKVELLCRLEM